MTKRKNPAVLGFRCTEDEKRLIQFAAAASDSSLSKWLHEAAIKAMQFDLDSRIGAIGRADQDQAGVGQQHELASVP